MPKKRNKFAPLGQSIGCAPYVPQPGLDAPEEPQKTVALPPKFRTSAKQQPVIHRSLQGHIKHWNADRGFGFIEPENGLEDLFVHASELKQGTELMEEDVVTFDAVVNADRGGLKAVNVAATGCRIVRERHFGIVVFWRDGQFGFIEPSAAPFGGNVIAHSEEVVGRGNLEVDDEATFAIKNNKGRAVALDVRATGRKEQSQQGKRRDIEKGDNCQRCGQPVYDCPCRRCECRGCTRRNDDDMAGPNVGMSGDPGAARRRWLEQLNRYEDSDHFFRRHRDEDFGFF